jgi:hypothetical protein
MSFFRFLLSGERDLEKFAASRQRKQGGPSPHVMLGASLSEGVMGDKNKHRHGIMRGNGTRGENRAPLARAIVTKQQLMP